MNSDEQALIDGLFTRLQQAEKDSAPRDALAQERIKQHVTAQPAAPYYMAQAILVQEAAIKRLDEQNRKLQADLAQAQAQAQAAPAQSGGGGFLSSIFGSGARDSRPAEPSTGGWREPAPRYAAPPPQPQQGYAQPAPAPAAAPAGGGFMRGALQTAAGVAGGVMLAEGISSLFHHNSQPQEIVEVLQEPAAQSNDWNGSGSGDEQRLSDNSSFGNNDAGGFADSGYDDGGSGFFSDDDDSFV